MAQDHRRRANRSGIAPLESDVTPLVTIGMPVYNGGRYVEEAVRSLLSQTEGDFVLLISDNCSTDETSEICRRLAAEDARIRYIRQDVNIGPAPNFEYVLRNAHGHFFVWAAHDDLWEPRFLEESIRLLRQAPSAIGCAVGVRVTDSSGQGSTATIIPPRELSSDHVVARARAVRHAQAQPVYGVFRLNLLLGSKELFPDVHGGDYVFLFRLALRYRFTVTDEILTTRRLVGYDVTEMADGRTRSAKMLGPDGHLFRKDPHRMSVGMLLAAWSGPLRLWQRAALTGSVARFWFEYWRLGMLHDSPARVKRSIVERRYGRAGILVVKHAILRPRRVADVFLRPTRTLTQVKDRLDLR